MYSSGLGGGVSVPRGDSATDLPGPLPAQLRDARCTRPAARPHHCDAPRAARAPARAQLARYVTPSAWSRVAHASYGSS